MLGVNSSHCILANLAEIKANVSLTSLLLRNIQRRKNVFQFFFSQNIDDVIPGYSENLAHESQLLFIGKLWKKKENIKNKDKDKKKLEESGTSMTFAR